MSDLIKLALLNNLATLALVGALIWRMESKRRMVRESDVVYWGTIGFVFGFVVGGILLR